MLLADSGVVSKKRIYLLAASVPRRTSLDDTATTSDYVKAVDYRSISSFLRQCDKYLKQIHYSNTSVLRTKYLQVKSTNHVPPQRRSPKKKTHTSSTCRRQIQVELWKVWKVWALGCGSSSRCCCTETWGVQYWWTSPLKWFYARWSQSITHVQYGSHN